MSLDQKVRDHSASLAIFAELQKRFRDVKLVPAGWAVEPNDPERRLYLKLLWPNGILCHDSGDFYYDFPEGVLPPGVDASGGEKSAKAAWKTLNRDYLKGASFIIDPVFALCETPLCLEDYSNSSIDVVCSAGLIQGLHLPLIKASGWGEYFPSSSESLEAKLCRALIEEVVLFEEARWRHGTKSEFKPHRVIDIEDNVKEYKTQLGITP